VVTDVLEPFAYPEAARFAAIVRLSTRHSSNADPGPRPSGIQLIGGARIQCECERCLADLRIINQRGPKAFIYPSELVLPPETPEADD
jgi:hypothetical protein